VPTTSLYALPYQALTDPPHGPDLGKDLAEAVEGVLHDGTKALVVGSVQTTGTATVAGDLVGASCNGICQVATTSPNTDTTTSATYVNMAGTGSVTSFTFVKRFASTRIKVDLDATFSTSATGSGPKFGVRINGADYDLCQIGANAPSAVHTQASGVKYISGIPAGTYTIQGRWLRLAGAGTLTRDFNDWLAISAAEVAA
jgi:hypothetical protein